MYHGFSVFRKFDPKHWGRKFLLQIELIILHEEALEADSLLMAPWLRLESTSSQGRASSLIICVVHGEWHLHECIRLGMTDAFVRSTGMVAALAYLMHK